MSGATFIVKFRVANLTLVHGAPKIAAFEGKFGQLYAGKEKLYSQKAAFMIPKASPLKASYDLVSCKGIFTCKSNNFRETSDGQYLHGSKWE